MNSSVDGTHMIVLPGGGYAEHAPHEAEPVARWLGEIGVQANVFRYPLNVRHPVPLDALRAEISRRRAASAQRIGLIGFSAGGHLAGLAALAPGAAPDETVRLDPRTGVTAGKLAWAMIDSPVLAWQGF